MSNNKNIIKKFKNQSGQTIIEVTVALALLALAISSAGALATTSARITSEAGRRTQATALAVKELESLRVYRDTSLSPLPTSSDNSGCSSYILTLPNALTSQATPVAYTGSTYSGFSRLMTICNTASTGERAITVQVVWSEANGTRTVEMRTILRSQK